MPTLNDFARLVLSPLSDAVYIRLQYLRNHRRLPDLRNPTTLNEKIQWLKLYYRVPLLKRCADKVAVRDYVAERVGSQYLVPAAGIYASSGDIDFTALPSRFVLKASHGSGWNIICRDRRGFDEEGARALLGRWMQRNFYNVGREWAYDGLEPRILCEEFISGPDGESPWDYKVFCFHGRAHFVQVDYGRFSSHTRVLYDTDWSRIPCALEYPVVEEVSARPQALREMLKIAEDLAADFPFVRVDLYEVEDKIFFGEMTFYPGKGVERFSPRSCDESLGKWLDLERVAAENREVAFT